MYKSDLKTGKKLLHITGEPGVGKDFEIEQKLKSKQLDIHGYSDRFGNEPTLKEDVYSALMRVREMEDIVRPLSHKYYFPNGEDDYSDEHKAIVEIVKKNIDHFFEATMLQALYIIDRLNNFPVR